ncbi:MAG: efflux RND transporter periplasmic adaptor subunit [Verrucomicrobiales bacterium]|nr:efflux RND transporter periplasmic adaptor subunit [Verrucomicrobiales bacterium]
MESTKPKTSSHDLSKVIASAKPSGRSRWIRRVIVLVLMVAAAVSFVLLKKGEENASAEGAYLTEAVRRGNIELTVTATGNLEPTNEVTIGSELSGTAAEVLVDVNDQVTVGQKLARIEVRRLAQEINQSRAALLAAEATVEQVEATLAEHRATLGRQEELHQLSNGRMPSQADLNTARAAVTRSEADLTAAKASVEQARAGLEANEEEQSKSVLKSPINGIVLSRSLEPGQTVAASFEAPELFVVAEDLKKMKLEVAVAEADIGRVEEKQAATFTVDAWPSRSYSATVTRVSYGSEVTDNVVTYATELEVLNEDLSLRPGMTATADIRVAQHKDVLLVPDAALRFDPMKGSDSTSVSKEKSFMDRLIPGPPRGRGRPAGDAQPPTGNAPAGSDLPSQREIEEQAKVWTLKDGIPVPIPVEVGLSEGGFTEVSADTLSEGLSVIVRKQAPRS